MVVFIGSNIFMDSKRRDEKLAKFKEKEEQRYKRTKQTPIKVEQYETQKEEQTKKAVSKLVQNHEYKKKIGSLRKAHVVAEQNKEGEAQYDTDNDFPDDFLA